MTMNPNTMNNENLASGKSSSLEERLNTSDGNIMHEDCNMAMMPLVAAVAPERLCSREYSLGSCAGEFVACMMQMQSNNSSPPAIPNQQHHQQGCSSSSTSVHTRSQSSIIGDSFMALMQSSTSHNADTLTVAATVANKDRCGDAGLQSRSSMSWLEQEQYPPLPSLSGGFSLDFFEAERLADAGKALQNNDNNNNHVSMEMPALLEANSLALPPELEDCPVLLHSTYGEQDRVYHQSSPYMAKANPEQGGGKQLRVSNHDYSSGSSSSCSSGSVYREGEEEEEVDHRDVYEDDDEDYKESAEVQRQPCNNMKRKRAMIHCQTKQKRSRKAYEPHVKVYVEYKDEDVLCQRGGLSNSHPGNILYRKAKEALQPKYFAASKACKTDVSQELVDQVHAWGGRFLKKDTSRAAASLSSSSCWYEVHNHVARTKAGQALREVYTPEKGAAKRDKYTKK